MGLDNIAIVIPYYDETPRILSRCIESVQNQSVKVDTILVADGKPRDWIDASFDLRHIKLDIAHGDNGNTPRGIGGMLAAAENYDAICFLDADNWYEKNHIETCIEAIENSEIDIEELQYVVSGRKIVTPDGDLIDHKTQSGHVDTSEFMFLPGAYFIIPYWVTMPKEFGPICDRIMNLITIKEDLNYVKTGMKTVNFLMRYYGVYIAENLPVPPEADHKIQWEQIRQWYYSLSKNQQNYICSMIGFNENTLII